MKPSNVSVLEQKLFKDITLGTISENEEYNSNEESEIEKLR